VLAEFFTWWRQHLQSLVPEALGRGASPDLNAVVVEATGPDLVTLYRRRRGIETRMMQTHLDDSGLPGLHAALNTRPNGEAVLLRVPGAYLLERPVALPLAAERDVERVLTYDMERLTPFSAEEVYWAATVEARDRARGRLLLRLAVIPRSRVQDLVKILVGGGAPPSLIEAETPTGPRTIRLRHDTASGRIARLSPRAAAAVLGALAVLVVVSPILRQSLDIMEAQSQIDALAPRIALVNTLRNRIAGAGAGGDAVAGETKRLGDMMEAVAAITEILPDDSYLTEFTMRERKITLAGQAGSAPKLISDLSGDPRIRNPAFTAPVTKADNHNDVFAIRADLAQ
jgi:general secretion pathway protein L